MCKSLKNQIFSRRQGLVGGCIFIVFTLYSLYALLHHAPWRDEAQSWLLLRDLSFPQMFAQLKYEGHPILWYAMVFPLVKLGLPYASQNALQFLIIIAIAYIVCFKLNINFVLKIFILFSTSLSYMINVFARNYAISVLLMLLIYLIYETRFTKHFCLYGILIFLLLNSNIFASVVAIAFLASDFIILLLLAIKEKKPNLILNIQVITVFIIGLCGAILLLASMTSFFGLLHSPYAVVKGSVYDRLTPVTVFSPDYLTVALRRFGSGIPAVNSDALRPINNLYYNVFHGKNTNISNTLNNAFAIFLFISGIAACLFAKTKRTRLYVLLFSVFSMTGGLLMVYISQKAQNRQMSMIVFAVIVSYLLAMKSNDRSEQTDNGFKKNRVLSVFKKVFAVIMVLVICINSWLVYSNISKVFMHYDSGAKGAANYVIKHGYDSNDTLVICNNKCCGASVLPYFKNIKKFSYYSGDFSFAYWQECDNSDGNMPVETLINKAINRHPNDKQILFVSLEGSGQNAELKKIGKLLYKSPKSNTGENFMIFLLK
ncbi:MAG: hypothetical protein Q8876_06030 [Bacillota bacterium]|nr:hypothetical protein [Bacillota bacterium]